MAHECYKTVTAAVNRLVAAREKLVWNVPERGKKRQRDAGGNSAMRNQLQLQCSTDEFDSFRTSVAQTLWYLSACSPFPMYTDTIYSFSSFTFSPFFHLHCVVV